MRVASSLILTRLLSPDDYGVMAIVFSVIFVLGMLSDVGHHTLIIQKQGELDSRFMGVMYSFQILRGLVIWAFCLICAGIIWLLAVFGVIDPQSAYADPVLPAILIVTGFAQVILGFDNPYFAVAVRNLSGHLVFICNATPQVLSIILTIGLALITPTVWVLAAGAFSAALFKLGIVTWVFRENILLPRWDNSLAKEAFSKSKWIILSSVSTALSHQADRLILGLLVPAAVLGIYSIGVNFPILFRDSFIITLLIRICFPAFSEVLRNTPDAISKTYYRLRTGFDLVLFTLAGGLLILGDEFILILYDPRYAQAGEIAVMMGLMLAILPYEMIGNLLMARGDFKYVGLGNALSALVLIILLPTVFSFGGIESALYVIAFARAPGSLFWLFIGYRAGIVRPLKELRFVPVIGFGVLIGLIVEWVIHTHLSFIL